MVLLQQIAQSFRPLAVVFQNVAAQLNAGKSKLRDFLDGLGVVSTPRNRRVPELNHSGRRRNGPIEVREVGRRIERRIQDASKSLNRNSRRGGDRSQTHKEMTTRE